MGDWLERGNPHVILIKRTWVGGSGTLNRIVAMEDFC